MSTGRLEMLTLLVLTMGGGNALAGQQPSAPPPLASQARAAVSDTVEVLYRQARAALNERRYDQAAELFARLRAEYRQSPYVGDAYYFEALARSRLESVAELRRAREVLELQLAEYPTSATIDEARALMVRLEGDLARRGSVDAARRIEEQARTIQQQRAIEQQERAMEQLAARNEEQARRAQESADLIQERSARALEESQRVARRNAEAQQSCEVEGEIRAIALNALADLDPAQTDPLIREILLDHEACNRQLREMALMIVARRVDSGDDGALDMLISLATESGEVDSEIQEMAFFMLARSESDRAYQALRTMAGRDQLRPALEEAWIWSLVQSGRPEAAELLEARLLSPTTRPGSREALVFALAEVGEPERLRRIYSRLEDPDLRAAVVWTIARGEGEASRAWLMERVRDEAEPTEVRVAALYRAADGGLPVDAILQLYRTAQDPELREQALLALVRSEPGQADDGRVNALIDIVRSEEDAELRQMALMALTRVDDPRVSAFLAELARGGGGM